MKSPRLLAVSSVAFLAGLTGCASPPNPEQQAAMVDNARKASAALVQALGGELRTALSQQGPDGAISVCKERAPKIAADVSKQFGVTVNRVSPKNRNPAGAPDAWEAEAQKKLEARLAAGEKPETLDTWQVVGRGSEQHFRYAKALATQPLCLTCHGDATMIPDSVKARLATEYPLDKAVGYAPGSIRGIVSISRPL